MKNFIKSLAITTFIGLACLCALQLVGCAKLEVKVSVYNPELDDQPALTRKRAARAAENWERLRINGFEDARVSAINSSMKAFAVLRDANIIAAQDYDRTQTKVSDTISSAFTLARAEYDEGFANYLVARGDTSNPPQYKADARFRQAITHFTNGDEILNISLRAIRADFNTARTFAPMAHATPDGSSESIDQLIAKIDAAERLTASQMPKITGTDLTVDPDISVIASAPPRAWSGTFNRVYGHGNIGNTDIAIVASTDYADASGGVPTFVMKGIRLDASNVTRATFQGIKDMLRVAAVASGVPLAAAAPQSSPQPGTSPTGKGTSDEVNAGISHAAATTNSNASLERSRAAMISLLDSMLAASNGLDPDQEEQFKASVTSITQAFNVYKTRLTPGQSQQGKSTK